MKTKTRILSLVLCLAMVIGYFTFGVSAEGETATFEKVTTAPADWSGTYLIVYEDGNLIFDGSRDTLDAVSNTHAITIRDGKIEATDEIKARAFVITPVTNGYSIKSASGYYIGQTSNANGLQSSGEPSYTNTLSMNTDGSVNIVSGGAYLRYNAASNQNRFRYYKSSSYTGQKAICLYKLVEGGGSETPVDPDTCEHSYGAGVETTPATETTEGVMTYKCTLCGTTKTEAIPMLEPTEKSTFVKVTEAPSDWSGTYLIVCETDGITYVFNSQLSEPDAADNNIEVNIVNGKITIDEKYAVKIDAITGGYSIQTNAGLYIGGKSGSNDLTTNDSTALLNELSFTDGHVDIVSNTSHLRFNGAKNSWWFRYFKSSTYSSQQPIDLYKLESESTEKFTVEKTNMRFGSDLSLLFAFKQSDIADLSAVKAKIVQSTDSGSETVYINGSGWTTTTIDEVDYYVVEYSGIAGKEMSDEVTIVVEDAEGNELSTSFTTSIRTYAMARLENTTDAEFKRALVDMLNYGAAAQTHFENYNAENPANALLTSAQEGLASAEGEYEDKRSISDENIVKASNLRFASKISMLFSLNATCRNTYAVFTWKDHKGADHEVKVETYSTLEDGSLVVELTGLVVADARQMVTCTIYGQNNNAVAVVTDSVESYAARCSEDTVDLAVAFMKFADSAYAYLH